MSNPDVDLIRSLIDAWNEGGDPSLDAYHQDAEFDFSGWGMDMRGSFRGQAEIRSMLDSVAADWEEVRVEPEQFSAAGDEVSFFARFYARRRENGLDVSDAGTCVFTLRDGKIARFELLRGRTKPGERRFARGNRSVAQKNPA